ncbi:hypothetical protein [Rubinisphaera italica]|uniref:hypothetical protein n=1 Tax=Rubinisphaera italica TaxID=2527969 RepID=UPI0013EF1AB3|nr:hypothetical protein [Rubinisphaera italica]
MMVRPQIDKQNFQKMSEYAGKHAAEVGQQLLKQAGKLFASIRRCQDGTIS